MTITHRSISVRAARSAGAGGLTLCSLLLNACGGGTNPPDNLGPPTAGYVQLQVSADGDGSGLIASDPAGITCTVTFGSGSGSCAANFKAGTAVTLTASGAFSIWYAPCSGSAVDTKCALSLSTDSYQAVNAGFGTLTSLTAIFAPITGTGGFSMGLVDIAVRGYLSPVEGQAKVPVSAQLRIIGRPGTVALAGTYGYTASIAPPDSAPARLQFCLLEAPVGGADPCASPTTTLWQFKVTSVDPAGNGSGAFSGPDPTTPAVSAPGLFRLENKQDGAGCSRGNCWGPRTREVFCGRLLDANQGELGQWVVTGLDKGAGPSTQLGGLANVAGALYNVAGYFNFGPTEKSIALTSVSNGVEAYHATIVRTGDSIGGTWSSTDPAGGPSGAWGATKNGCQ